MTDHTLSHTRMPADYAEFLSSAAGLNIDGLELRSGPLESMVEYVHSERIPADFPRPEDHFVIGDYLIDLPVIAIDLRADSSSYGRVMGYAYGNYWLIAHSLPDFLQRLKVHKDGAVWEGVMGMNDASNPSPDKAPSITIDGSVEEPSHEMLLTYVGRIVHVGIGVSAGAGWVSYADLYRFARVVAVHPRTPETSICSHCDQEARSAVGVLWESGFSTTSKTICECCIDGVVTSGAELIDFPSGPK